MPMVEAIAFPVFVKGKPLIASVVEVVENPVQYSYRIRFSDGYEDIFTLDDGAIDAKKGENSKIYIKAIRNDITQVARLNTGKFYHVFQDKIDGQVTNIWIIESEDENGETYYGVYYNEFYRFELRQVQGEWIWSTRSKEPGVTINEDIAGKVQKILYSLV